MPHPLLVLTLLCIGLALVPLAAAEDPIDPPEGWPEPGPDACPPTLVVDKNRWPPVTVALVC